jgi:HlyD family secretion protein
MFNLNMELMNFLPILSFLVLITIRLIPSISNLNVNINEMLFNEDSFNVFIQNKISDINNVNKITTIETSNNYYKDLEIELNSISFRYQDNPRYILKDLDIIFKENNIIGLTGSSGSGKSTLVKLIMGFLKPDKGNVLINKKRLFFDDLDWQSQIGYMPQRILLTNSFLRNNIAMGEDDNEINDNKILKILDNIYFKKIIDYEKFSKIKIYEDGSNLSGGQIQLVGLARALYNDQKIIILDEPTNNLDFKLKEIFMKFLYEIKRKKIIIVISHDKEILKMCDKSYILRNSKLDKFEAHLN